ncbi:hypothetical protein M0R36_09215 [bacterium]|jgi:hypothetical protein|nr:hypothetical protein [bacterium]
MNIFNHYNKKIRELDREINKVKREIIKITSNDTSSKRRELTRETPDSPKDGDERKKLANYLGAGSIQTLGMHKYHKEDLRNKIIYAIVGILFVLALIWLISR